MIKTQFVKAQWKDDTFTDQNQLSAAMLRKPEIYDNLIYACNYKHTNSVLQFLTQGLSGTKLNASNYKVIGNEEIMWALMGKLTRSIPITGPVSPNFQAGIGFSQFVVPMAEKYFALGDVVIFSDLKKARVQTEPYQQGQNWCYTMQLITSDPNAFVSPGALNVGQEVGFAYTSFEEGSEGGASKTATPMMFKNQMTIQRMAYGMTGSAKTDILWWKFDTGKGKKDLWLYKRQYENYLLWQKAQEIALWEAEYNRLSDDTIVNRGANGRPIRVGSGIQEQIGTTNRIVTSQLTEEMLKYMLLDLGDNCNEADTKRLVVVTGKGGIDEFDKAMRRAMIDLGTYISSDSHFVRKTRDGENTLSFGSNFTNYKGLLGTEFTVVHHPLFDDKSVYTAIDPQSGFTVKSYEMYFLDFSDYNNEPNIFMVTKGAGGEDRRFVEWYTDGATSIDFSSHSRGQKTLAPPAKHSSNGFDGFMHYMLSETGVVIQNPLGCGVIKIVR